MSNAHDHSGVHGHEHDTHGHSHDQAGHSHDHHRNGILGFLAELNPLHSHAVSLQGSVLESGTRGIRAVQVSLVILTATAGFQVAVVIASGSVALLADTIHNFTDALTAVPLWLAFALGRRPVSRRYTYGHGRIEDLAGVLVVLFILASALLAGYESYRKMVEPEPLRHLGWVMAAAIIGFLGNEAVAIFRIRIGSEIGSAALIADGQHARVDGLTSLAVLLGALGVLAGWDAADPVVGAVITIAILFIVKDTGVMIWQRLMDAVDPDLVRQVDDAVAKSLADEPASRGVDSLRVRWLGHALQVELNLGVDETLSTGESHRIAEHLRHDLFHAFPQLTSVAVHVDPVGADGHDHHDLTSHHASPRP